MQRLDVVFDTLNQLGLIFTYSTTNVRSYEQCIEARKDAEHFVGILCRSQLITKMCSDSSLHTICVDENGKSRKYFRFKTSKHYYSPMRSS